MKLYELPQSLIVLPKDNKIPPFGLTIDFAEGAFADHYFAPNNVNDLWALLGGAFSLLPKIFFEIERKDSQLKFQGFGNEHGFCLFQDTYKHEILIFGQPSINEENSDLLQIWDDRWGLTYFLPRTALVDFEKMVMLGNQVLQTGKLPEHIAFSQKFTDLGLPEGYC